MRGVGLLLACVIGCAIGTSAQRVVVPTADADAAYVPTMTFDVATVRESKVDLSRGVTMGGGFRPAASSHLLLQNFTLENLIRLAYLISGQPVEGLQKLPDAMRQAYFNVEAKSDVETDERLAKLDKTDRQLEQNHMIQAMLADRLNLKVHWEARDREVFNLLVSKVGRLHSTGTPPTPQEVAAWGDRGVPPLYQRGGPQGLEYIAHGASTANIAGMLSGQFGRPVVDKTGLTGKYDFDLKYFGSFASQRKEDETNPLPPLDTAIQDELGLKIVPSHGPVRVLVIDHVEMPSAN